MIGSDEAWRFLLCTHNSIVAERGRADFRQRAHLSAMWPVGGHFDRELAPLRRPLHVLVRQHRSLALSGGLSFPRICDSCAPYPRQAIALLFITRSSNPGKCRDAEGFANALKADEIQTTTIPHLLRANAPR